MFKVFRNRMYLEHATYLHVRVRPRALSRSVHDQDREAEHGEDDGEVEQHHRRLPNVQLSQPRLEKTVPLLILTTEKHPHEGEAFSVAAEAAQRHPLLGG